MSDTVSAETRRRIGGPVVRPVDDFQPLKKPDIKKGSPTDATGQKIIQSIEENGGLPGEVSGAVFSITKHPATTPGFMSTPDYPRVAPMSGPDGE